MKLFPVILLSLILRNGVKAQQRIDTSMVASLRIAKQFMHGKDNAIQLSLELQGIYVQQELFWLCFSIRNRSGLSYPIDLVRLYLHDKIQSARSSMQELEVIPVYMDSLTMVKPHATNRFLIAIPKFTIPDSKYFMIEIFENNGARNLSLNLTNWQLFKARPVPTKQNAVSGIVE